MTIELQNLLKRIELLEAQVRTLQVKVEQLEQEKGAEPQKPRFSPGKEQLAETAAAATSIELEPKPQPVPVQPKKPAKTLEQWIASILPKVFILILVLGVLWGLKFASDYGYFNDAMKVLLGYVGSVVLFAIAFWMEKKQKGAMQVALMLYGGAFVVGILATAAGAILYEVLGLYVALFITLMYIAYGVAISYLKGSESLTVLVAITSFLLPYLLEYMNFNSYIIVGYVVLLFAVVQLVILKHGQKYALYTGTFFSVLALVIVTFTASIQSVVFSLSITVVASIFLVVLRKLIAHIRVGFVFSFLMYMLLALNVVVWTEIEAAVSLGLLIAVLVAVAMAAKKAGQLPLFEVTLSTAFIALMTLILQLNNSYTVDLLLVFVTATVGLLLAIRLRSGFMQVTKGLLFALVGLVIVAEGRIEPFWSLAHLTYVLVAVALVLLYMELRKPIEEPTKFEALRERLRLNEWVMVALYLVVLLYTMHFQDYYIEGYSGEAYIALLFIVMALLAVIWRLPVELNLPLYVTVTFAFAIAYVILIAPPHIAVGEEWIGLVFRLLYVGVLAFLLYSFMSKGIAYKRMPSWSSDVVWICTILALLIGIFGLTSFAERNLLVGQNVEVIANTVSIFAASALSLFVGARFDYSNVRLFGLGLLFVSVIKLIFFDLSALDLIVRSVLFIIIGAVGLVLSNKLLTKK